MVAVWTESATSLYRACAALEGIGDGTTSSVALDERCYGRSCFGRCVDRGCGEPDAGGHPQAGLHDVLCRGRLDLRSAVLQGGLQGVRPEPPRLGQLPGPWPRRRYPRIY